MLKIHMLENPDEYRRGDPIRIGPNVGVVLFRLGPWQLIRWDYWAWG